MNLVISVSLLTRLQLFGFAGQYISVCVYLSVIVWLLKHDSSWKIPHCQQGEKKGRRADGGNLVHSAG